MKSTFQGASYNHITDTCRICTSIIKNLISSKTCKRIQLNDILNQT